MTRKTTIIRSIYVLCQKCQKPMTGIRDDSLRVTCRPCGGEPRWKE